VFAASAVTFSALLGARLLQGLMSASTRVLAVAIVRDGASGRKMARTMSVAQMIFFIVPILAPTFGQALLAFGPWRFIFYALGAFAAFVLAWTLMRLPETLPAARRVPISMIALRQSYRLTLTNRFSVGYALAASLTFGGIIAFVSSSQQIFVEEFGAGARFTWLFAICAGAMGVAAFANSRLVERLGTRMISQSAVLALIALAMLHLLVIDAGLETLTSFTVLQALSMTCIGLCGSNFGSMAMEPVGHIAGTASSVQGFQHWRSAGGLGHRPLLRRHDHAAGDRLIVHRPFRPRDRLRYRRGSAVPRAHGTRAELRDQPLRPLRTILPRVRAFDLRMGGDQVGDIARSHAIDCLSASSALFTTAMPA
jgi:DHA1 family bicyclomycin/chloramphenicol resistance-like MFS transporter